MLLTDLQIPNMDDYSLTREIRAEEARSGHKRMPIIALTAYAMAAEDAACLASGMDDFLSKPVLLTELRKRIQKWLELEPVGGGAR